MFQVYYIQSPDQYNASNLSPDSIITKYKNIYNVYLPDIFRTDPDEFHIFFVQFSD